MSARAMGAVVCLTLTLSTAPVWRDNPGPRPLIEQVLPPLGVAFAQHAHQMPAGVQAKGARLPHQPHSGLFGCAIALSIVARMAAGDQVFPSRFARSRPRDYVVERQ